MKAPLTLLIFSLLSFAVPSNAALVCSAQDRGWEEHWSGHRNCGECLAHHDSCIETCKIEYTRVEVQGVDIRGNAIRIAGDGDTRYDAERQAMNTCRSYLRDCQVVSSNSKTVDHSRTECRRDAVVTPGGSSSSGGVSGNVTPIPVTPGPVTPTSPRPENPNPTPPHDGPRPDRPRFP